MKSLNLIDNDLHTIIFACNHKLLIYIDLRFDYNTLGTPTLLLYAWLLLLMML